MLKSVAKAAQLPVMEIAAENVHIIQTPSAFYDKLKDGIRRSKRKIFLASLYLGTSEKELVEPINEVDELTSKLSKDPAVEVSILLDYFRGTRQDHFGNSSATMLRPLYTKFPTRVNISFYHSPNGYIY
jgi:CDP-diacylglycerol--glycerol-3-phosphate 3-phosphatidyltransferase